MRWLDLSWILDKSGQHLFQISLNFFTLISNLFHLMFDNRCLESKNTLLFWANNGITFMHCFQKENEKAKSIREQEEKYIVSAWYNIVSIVQLNKYIVHVLSICLEY